MESIISKLFFNEDVLTSENSDEKIIKELISEKEKIIISALSYEQKKIYNEYDSLRNEQNANDCLTAYCAGFKYAAKLFAEALKDK